MRIPLPALLLLFPVLAISSPELDAEYGYRSISAVVTNVDKEPVYGEQVENEIVGFLRSNMRFEFSDPGYLMLREKIRPFRQPMSEMAPNTVLEPLKPVLQQLDKIGVTAVILGEVAKNNENEYVVVLQLATTRSQETAFNVSVKVDDGSSLESFSAATRNALAELMKWIPFDASVIKRDGFLVVLDRGHPAFHKGQQLTVYTVEKKPEGILFEESGVVGLTQVDEHLAFGRILVEKKPIEVTVGNKIRLDNKPAFRLSPSQWNVGGRDLASESSSSFEVTKGKFGVLSAGFGPSLVTYETQNTKGTDKKQMNTIFPTGTIAGEIWLTSRFTFSLGMKYGMGGKEENRATGMQVGTSLNGFRALAGYRINLLAPEPGPIIHFKLGYGKENFAVETPREFTFVGTTYSGILVGGGVGFPVTERIGLGFDVTSLIFPSVTEQDYTSGNQVSNVSAWDFAIRGSFRYDKNVDFEAKIFFQRNGADFTGEASRLANYTSTSQISRGLILGVSYYF